MNSRCLFKLCFSLREVSIYGETKKRCCLQFVNDGRVTGTNYSYCLESAEISLWIIGNNPIDSPHQSLIIIGKISL